MSASLASYISWADAASHLGITPRTAALPAVTPCPSCEGDLWVYPDTSLGGQWLWCCGCGFAGDLIEFAARLWSLEIPPAINRLRGLGLLPQAAVADDSVQSYIADHISQRARMTSFWEECRKGLIDGSPGVGRLLEVLGLGSSVCCPYFAQRGSMFLGAASRLRIEEALHPNSYASRSRKNHGNRVSVRRGSGAGGSRLFKGAGWDDLLVVPFRDLPGRICGFLFVGRAGDGTVGDIVYHPVLRRYTGGTPIEAGLAMHEAAFTKLPDLDGLLIVATDPLEALRIQLNWMRSSDIPLPLVAAHLGAKAATQGCLAALPHISDRTVVWARTVDADAMRLAKEANCRIAKRVLTDGQWRKLEYMSATSWMSQVGRQSHYWRAAVVARLVELDTPSAVALLERLQFDAADVNALASYTSNKHAERIKAIANAPAMRRVRLGRHTIIERESGWYLATTERRICNAAIRIDEIVTTVAGRASYRGWAHIEGAKIHFELLVREVEGRGLLPRLRQFLIETGHPPIVFDPAWAKWALDVALQFHPPKQVRAVEQAGWNDDLRAFVLPKCRLSKGSPISFERLLAIDKFTPGRSNPAPRGVLTEFEVASLGEDSSEVRLFWATAACVLYNIFAPAVWEKPVGIALEGRGAQTIGRLAAQMLGCVTFRIPGGQYHDRSYEATMQACDRHRWPVVLVPPHPFAPRCRDRLLTQFEPVNGILPVSPYTGRALAIHGFWHVIRSDRELYSLARLRRSAPYVVGNMVAYFCERGLELNCRIQGMLHQVVDLMADWFRSRGGNAVAIPDCIKVLEPAGSRAAWQIFGELLSLGLGDGRIRQGKLRAATPGDKVSLWSERRDQDGKDAIWIPQRGLNEMLLRHKELPVDAAIVTKSLRDAGHLLEEAEYHGDHHWVVPADWLADQALRWKNAYETRPLGAA